MCLLMCPAGTLHYAVAHSRLLAPFGARQLAFSALAPPSAAVLAADPAAFRGGVVASGRVAVPTGGQWASVRVAPPCAAAALCQLSLHALHGGTDYVVFLVGESAAGAVDPVPAQLSVTTAPATSAPALLPGSGPSNVTDSGFAVQLSTDSAGAVYFALLKAKPGEEAAAAGGDVPPGSWSQLASLMAPDGGSANRRLLSSPGLGLGHAAGAARVPAGRQLAAADNSSGIQPGSLVAPACYPANRSCSLAPPTEVFGGVAGWDSGFDVLASGCLPVPAAGRRLALPPFSGLQNDTLYHIVLATEDTAVPQPNRMQPPTAFAVRTVDLSAPRLACGFPMASNITPTGFALSALLTKPGASVRYVVLPAAEAGTPPTAEEVARGSGPGGTAPAAAGNLTAWGHLPWEAPPQAGSWAGDPRRLWAAVTGLQGSENYTAFLLVAAAGNGGSPGQSGTLASLR